VRDRAAFEATYGTGHPIAGVFANGSVLRNEGETITLEDALGGTVHALTYAPSSPWPTRAAGGGHSLVLIAPETKPDPKDAANWRLSAKVGGSPGGSDLVPYPLEPTGDADRNGQPDLLDHAFGNDLGLPALAPTFVLEPASKEHPAALRFSYPISLGAERVRTEVLLSTNLKDWREGTDDFAESTLRPLGDGRAWVDRRFKAAVLREPRVFVRLRAVPR
jgi:hypothetical protein